ncbi:MAG: hypothetical protein SXU28_00155 [Pseudomonadota bacterium]|nr:hypothetical protein [Pseudomonadota bacterium]
MRRRLLTFLVGAGLTSAGLGFTAAMPANAAPPRVDYSATIAAIEAFQNTDQRLQDVGWRLASANAPFCQKVIPSIGLQVQDVASFTRPAIAKAALRLDGAFAVQSVAKGSPAAMGYAFARNREIARLGGQDPSTWPAKDKLDWQRWVRTQKHITSELEQSGSIAVQFGDGEVKILNGVPICDVRFELMSGTSRAVSNTERVAIGDEFPSFNWAEEDEFAGVVAHEMAHTVLGHTVWLDRNKRKRKHVRATEREADRLMPWLLANAGYDPRAAIRFMERWGKKHGRSFLTRSFAYEGWDERAEHIAAEAAIVEKMMANEGKADWKTHFRREINPAGGLAKNR